MYTERKERKNSLFENPNRLLFFLPPALCCCHPFSSTYQDMKMGKKNIKTGQRFLHLALILSSFLLIFEGAGATIAITW